MRCALVCLLAGVIAAAAADAPLPEAMVIKAGGGGSFSLRPDAPSQFVGGVEMVYGGVILRCQTVSGTRAPYPGSRDPVVSEADLSAGPQGPQRVDGPCVEIDTRHTTLPKIAFRGLLSPGQVHVSRLAADPQRPRLIRFHVTLIPMGPFAGELRRNGRWLPYRGWAERAEAELAGDMVSGGIASLRLVRLVLHGAPDQGGGPSRLAWLVGPNPHQAQIPGQDAGQLMRAEADRFVFTFTEQGEFEQIDTPGYSRFENLLPEASATAAAAQTATAPAVQP